MLFASLVPRQRWLLVAGIAAVSLMVVAIAYRAQLARTLAQATEGTERLRGQVAKSAASPILAERAQRDFATTLPEHAPVERLVQLLQRESVARGVALVSVAATSREGTAQVMGRTEVTMLVRGGYSPVKAVLAEAVERTPGLVMQRLALRRQAAEVEAQVNLLLLTRPVAVPGR